MSCTHINDYFIEETEKVDIIPLLEKNNFCLIKICEKYRKDHIFVSFHAFPFHENTMSSELSFKGKCKKAVYFRKCVLMKDEIL